MKLLLKSVFYPTSYVDYDIKIRQLLASAGFTVITLSETLASVKYLNMQEYRLNRHTNRGYESTKVDLPNVKQFGVNRTVSIDGRPFNFAAFDNGDFIVELIFQQFKFIQIATKIDTKPAGGPGVFPCVLNLEVGQDNYTPSYRFGCVLIERMPLYTNISTMSSTVIANAGYENHPLTNLPTFCPMLVNGGTTNTMSNSTFHGVVPNYLFAPSVGSTVNNFQHIFIGGKRYIAIKVNAPLTNGGALGVILALDEE